MMLAMGAVREQGVVDSVRNNEFGFIRPTDRTEQIYFRLDDLADPEAKVTDGTEVEFFVIAENSKGKMSDRAVHLTILPSVSY
jgi:cold shock CspA family protein